MKRAGIYLTAAALSLVLCVLCLPQRAFAFTWIPKQSLRDPCSLSLVCKGPNIHFDLYRVAAVDEYVNFEAEGSFAGRGLSFKNLGASGWDAMTKDLTELVNRENILPYQSGDTDRGGSLIFSGLPAGLYLVCGRDYEDDEGGRWRPTDFMVCLPNWDDPAQSGSGNPSAGWVNHVTVDDKVEYIKPDVTEIHVLKVWRDNNNRDRRPDFIEVELRRNGREYDTVRLSARNNWSYDWYDLDPRDRWRVVEVSDVPGYVTTSEVRGLTTVITNRWDPPDDPPGTDPEDPRYPTPDPPPEDPPGDPPDGPPDIPLEDPDIPLADLPDLPLDDPDIPLDDGVYIDDMEIPLANLPQTGVLWWPVPFLAIAGMFLVILGWGWNRRSALEEE